MIATLTGTMLAPGVSLNGRLYTPENITKAVSRMQARIADPAARRIVMRSHHAAGDDTTRIVGHITGVKVDDTGSAKYEAALNGSQAAYDILAATGDAEDPSLRNVSIYGWWVDEPKAIRQDGQMVETADDLEIDAVDFTAFPGVEGARIDKVTPAAGGKTRESAAGRHVITESVDAHIHAVGETAAPTPGVAVPTTETPRRADLLGETVIGECFACCDDDMGAGFSISANNGPIRVSISAWDGIDPAELQAIAMCAMKAACDALAALDPDMDGDIDVDGAPAADTDNSMEDDNAMESAPAPVAINPKQLAEHLARIRKPRATETAPATQTPQPTPAGQTVKESAVSDAQPAPQAATTTETAETGTPARTLTDGDIAALAAAFKGAMAVTPEPPAAESATTDTTAAVTEAAESTESATHAEQDPKAFALEVKKAADAMVREAIPEILKSYGVPVRKGFRTTENTELAGPASTEELWDNRTQVWNTVLPGGAPAPTA